MNTQVPDQITLFFSDVVLSFIGTAEQIRAKRYDFTQFGPIISGEGKDWEVVVRGSMAIKGPPPAYSGVMEK